MPQISVRGLEMPESPVRKLAPLATAAKNRGIKVYHLNIGQPDLPTPKVAIDAIRNIDREILEYSPTGTFTLFIIPDAIAFVPISPAPPASHCIILAKSSLSE